ncbi:hypothetical protein NDA13_005033 [Ustilago tritici]|nr:hypothetical protein NDA13_005033 [Ustilago tritici]
MPGISKKPSFSSNPGSAPGSPNNKTVRLAENPHISAFLSPKSRIYAGGHGYPGHPNPSKGNHGPGAFSATSVTSDAFAISGKQLTPDEVAQKIASMLKPGPPFFSRVSNADLIDFISDGSIMNCDKLRAQAEQLEAKKQASRANTAFVPSGTGKIPGAPATVQSGSGFSTKSGSGGMEDDGLWNAITLSVDIDCTTVELAKSVVVPTQVLQNNHFYNGNAQSLFHDIGAGIKYKFDNLVGKATGGLRHKASSSALGGAAGSSGSKIAPN